MPVERGESHLIKVDESEFGDSTLLASCRQAFDQMPGGRGWKTGRAYDLASITAAQLPTPPHPTMTTEPRRAFCIPSVPKNA